MISKKWTNLLKFDFLFYCFKKRNNIILQEEKHFLLPCPAPEDVFQIPLESSEKWKGFYQKIDNLPLLRLALCASSESGEDSSTGKDSKAEAPVGGFTNSMCEEEIIGAPGSCLSGLLLLGGLEQIHEVF